MSWDRDSICPICRKDAEDDHITIKGRFIYGWLARSWHLVFFHGWMTPDHGVWREGRWKVALTAFGKEREA